MPIKSFADWEAEQQHSSATQSALEQQVLNDMHMVALELGQRFHLDVQRIFPNTVRLTTIEDNNLSITLKDGENFEVLQHSTGSPPENLGQAMPIDQVYRLVQKFVND